MKEILECEVISPLLMHGVGKEAELREQSIKGVMRFWFRAIYGNLGLEDLKKEEAEIFGDTSKKSSFRLKILNKNLNVSEFKLLDYKELIEKELNKKKLEDKEEKKKILRKYELTKSYGFNINQNFQIEFSGKNLDRILKIFELSTILGEFGQRARRGFGSIQILNGIDIDESYIKNLIREINPHFNFESNLKYPYLKNFEIGKIGERDIFELLKRIGEAIHKYPYFGNANPRFASPVWVSVIQKEDLYYPIISELYSAIFCCIKVLNRRDNNFKNKTKKEKKDFCSNKLKDFKRAIL